MFKKKSFSILQEYVFTIVCLHADLLFQSLVLIHGQTTQSSLATAFLGHFLLYDDLDIDTCDADMTTFAPYDSETTMDLLTGSFMGYSIDYSIISDDVCVVTSTAYFVSTEADETTAA